jgi:hypothetical protein
MADGVTINVAVTVAVPLLRAVKDAILPLPVVASPMLRVLFVHV